MTGITKFDEIQMAKYQERAELFERENTRLRLENDRLTTQIELMLQRPHPPVSVVSKDQGGPTSISETFWKMVFGK